MANVFLNDEAYAHLMAAKKVGESFSDVVLREVRQEIDLKEFVGCCKGEDAERIKAEIKRERWR